MKLGRRARASEFYDLCADGMLRGCVQLSHNAADMGGFARLIDPSLHHPRNTFKRRICVVPRGRLKFGIKTSTLLGQASAVR